MAKLRPCLAEAIGTFALIFIGVGAIKAAGWPSV
jgi:glycerol uptake facilitator-like aquaporin